MQRIFLTLVIVAACAAPCAAQRLSLRIADGRVSLDATAVSLDQVLAEWSRVGDVIVLGARRLAPVLLTLRIHDLPEREALDLILAQAGGYAAQHRPGWSGRGSRYQRLAVAAPVPAVASPGPDEQPTLVDFDAAVPAGATDHSSGDSPLRGASDVAAAVAIEGADAEQPDDWAAQHLHLSQSPANPTPPLQGRLGRRSDPGQAPAGVWVAPEAFVPPARREVPPAGVSVIRPPR